MRDRSQRRRWWAALGILILFGLALVATVDRRPSRKDTDARIRFYAERTGGPGTYPVYASLGLAYLQKARQTGQTKFLDEAERALRQSLAYQTNFEALRGMAALSLARHRFHEALDYAQQALAALPGDPESQGLLFDAYLALGEERKAAATVDEMLKAGTNFASLTRLANLREAQGNFTEALRLMGQACTEEEQQKLPEEVLAWCDVRVGSIYLELCNAPQAEARYQSALRRLPDYVPALERLAEFRAAQGQFTEAMAIYEKLLRANSDPHVRIALAGLYAQTGRSADATREFNAARVGLRLSAESSSRDDWRPLALLLLSEKVTVAEGMHWALRDWENRRDIFAADTLAWGYFQQGDAARAWKILEPMMAEASRDPLILIHAGLIQLHLGNTVEGRRFLDQALACPLRLSPANRALAAGARR